MKIIYAIASLLLLVSSFSIYALGRCEIEKKTIVIYSNGMFNSNKNIKDSKDNLESFIKELIKDKEVILEPGEILELDVAKNIDPSALSQFVDVIDQKLGISWVQFKRMFNNQDYIPYHKNSEQWTQFAKEMSIIEKSFNNEILDKMVEDYMYYLNKGYRVIIVAHSQGNMYANEVYSRIVNSESGEKYKNSISIVSVGSPIDLVMRGNIPGLRKPHATAFEDIYMWAVRFFTVGTNSYTFKYKVLTEDKLGHSFSEAYLYDSESKKHIANGLKWSLLNTEFPSTAKSQEFIRLELNKVNAKVSMFIHEQYNVGQYIPVEYFSGREKYYTEENLKPEYSNVTYGLGKYKSTNLKDTYTLRCSSLKAMGEHYGDDTPTVNITAYIVNETDDYQPVRLELFDWKGGNGSYIELTSEPKKLFSDFITYPNEMGGVNYIDYTDHGGNAYFIHKLNRFITGYQNGELYKLENKINNYE